MKVVLVQDFSTYGQAAYGDADALVPGPGEVLVDVGAADVNYPDILYMEGKYQSLPPLPFVPGLAAAGRVSALGEGITAPVPGARVLVLPTHGCYADQLVAPAGVCFPIPDAMRFSDAAAFGLVYQTAYFALVERARLTPGQTVLVLGATGGIGMGAVQLAKALGAGVVIAASRGAEGMKWAKDFGADVAIDASMENLRDGLRDAVMAATEGRGADIVIDPVGGDLSAAAMRALAWCGHAVVIGFASGDIPKFAANYLLVKNISVSGLQWTDYRKYRLERVATAQRHIFELWEAGRLRPHVEVFALSRFAEALGAIASGSVRGKIVLETGGADD